MSTSGFDVGGLLLGTAKFFLLTGASLASLFPPFPLRTPPILKPAETLWKSHRVGALPQVSAILKSLGPGAETTGNVTRDGEKRGSC